MKNTFDDNYFINLTMKHNKKDPELYAQWALWCDQSNEKYFIDSKNDYFYTHVRTLDEINLEKQKHTIMELLNSQKKIHCKDFAWSMYERYLYSLLLQQDINNNPMYFLDWKEYKRKIRDQ